MNLFSEKNIYVQILEPVIFNKKTFLNWKVFNLNFLKLVFFLIAKQF
tara:strand:- start:41832 stop:41972 length:141 start_codon:yes stop_codon:yes gene_type:complete